MSSGTDEVESSQDKAMIYQLSNIDRWNTKCDVLIDGLNVGFDFDNGRKFRAERIERALEFFKTQKTNALAFIPADLNVEQPEALRINNLLKEGRLFEAPGKGIGDPKYFERVLITVWAFVIHFGKGATYLISNNKFKEMSKLMPPRVSGIAREHLIVPFTFENDCFVIKPRCLNHSESDSV